MLYLGCICSFGVGAFAGLSGIRVYIQPEPNPASGFALVGSAMSFIVIGLVFAVVDRFLKSSAPASTKVAVLKALFGALPGVMGLSRAQRTTHRDDDSKTPRQEKDDGKNLHT